MATQIEIQVCQLSLWERRNPFLKGLFWFSDIRKLQDKAKTSYALSTRRPRFDYELDLSQVFTGKNGNLLPPFLWMVICLVLWVLANYIFAVISHLRASFPAVLLLSVRLMAGHIKETFILLFTMAGACLIVFLVPGLFVLFPRILCGIASHLIEPGLKKALAID